MGNLSRSKCPVGLSALLAIGALAMPASAAFITFDPDGAAPANLPQTIGGLDWAVGNSLGRNLTQPVAGANFQHLYQATLAGVIDTQGLTVAPTGLNSTFEITAVMNVTESITFTSSLGPGSQIIVHQLAAVQSNSFFEIWYDPTPDANNLAGTGFNDGIRIYLGGPDTSQPSSGTYTTAPNALNTGPAIQLYDQFGPDNYAGKTSLVGSGGFSDENTVTSQDASFFLSQIASMSFNTSTVDPFKQVNPSQLFAALVGGVPPALVPNLGTINGQGTGPGTNDIQFQADANVSFTPVPEPGTMLLAAGFALMALTRRRTR